MKTGQTLSEIAAELEAQLKAKHDYVAPSSQLVMDPKSNLTITGKGSFELSELAHDQLAGRSGIPSKYYQRMRESAPELLAQNVNHWFQKEPSKKMVRTIGRTARAILSDRYRPLDNFDLAETALPLVKKMGCRVESSALTEHHLYLKLVTERITAEVVGDVVQMGIVISNSEVGCGSVKVEPMIWTLRCKNGMVAPDYSMRKYHVGRAGVEGSLADEFFRDETRQADDKAFWMKVRDTIEGSMKQDVFDKIVAKLRAAGEDEVTGDPVKVVEVTQERFGLSDDERGSVLRHLIKDGGLTRYGLLNAITASSQDSADYERATQLERIGGDVLELPRRDWAAIAGAK